jgi:hypothetical protein
MSDTDLTIKQHKAITALLTGANCPDVARQIGVNERTVQRWQQQPAFKAELDRQRRQLAEQALASLQGLAADAVATLRALLSHNSASIRLRTACYILDKAAAHLELEDLQLRVERLEDMSEDELKDVIRRLESQ